MDNDDLSRLSAELQREMNRKTLMNWVGKRSLADQRSRVNDPRRYAHIWWRALTWLLLAVVGVVWVASHSNRGIGTTVVITLLGACAGRGLALTLMRANAYADGWLQGRHGLMDSWREARQRGLDPDEWMNAEIEREFGTW
jgi:hypothetical protein